MDENEICFWNMHGQWNKEKVREGERESKRVGGWVREGGRESKRRRG